MEFIYQREPNLDNKINLTIKISGKLMQERKDLLVEMNIFYQA